MPKIQALTFDLEGTIIDVEEVHHTAHRMAAHSIGLDLDPDDCLSLLPHYIGGPDEEVAKEISKIAESKGIKTDYKKILLEKKKWYQNLIKKADVVPREGFLEFLNLARELGLKCSIGTLTSRDQAEVLLKRSGVGKYFDRDHIVYREDVKNVKPAPDVWLETAKRTQVDPDKQLIFEDSPRGIEGAKKIKARAIGMPTYKLPLVVKTLKQAGAEQVYFHWNQILLKHLLNEK